MPWFDFWCSWSSSSLCRNWVWIILNLYETSIWTLSGYCRYRIQFIFANLFGLREQSTVLSLWAGVELCFSPWVLWCSCSFLQGLRRPGTPLHAPIAVGLLCNFLAVGGKLYTTLELKSSEFKLLQSYRNINCTTELFTSSQKHFGPRCSASVKAVCLPQAPCFQLLDCLLAWSY